VLSGGDSSSCLNGQGESAPVDNWKCKANTLAGTLLHEVGHALGLNHPCQGWEADNWKFTASQCAALVMQTHWSYPNVGFDSREVGILSVSPFLSLTTATTTLTPTATSTPSPTATRTATPTQTPSPTLGDDFSSTSLGSSWTWIDPNADSTYLLSARPGSLRVSTPIGGNDLYPGSNFDAPRLLQTITGDFSVTTLVSTNPTSVYQAAGLLAWGDGNNFVRLERESAGVSMHFRNQGSHDGIPAVQTSAILVYLRLARSGSSLVGSFSTNGSTWTQVGSIQSQVGLSPGVGLTVLNQWQDNSYYADFDFFYR